MKLVINMLFGTMLAGLAETLALGEKVGLQQEQILEILSLLPISSKLTLAKGDGLFATTSFILFSDVRYSSLIAVLPLFQRDIFKIVDSHKCHFLTEPFLINCSQGIYPLDMLSKPPPPVLSYCHIFRIIIDSHKSRRFFKIRTLFFD